MNYPYKKNADVLIEGNEKFGGKVISPITEESLSYLLVLMNCDRLLAPYVHIGMAHIYSDYKDELEERSSMLIRCIRYDRPQTGYEEIMK